MQEIHRHLAACRPTPHSSLLGVQSNRLRTNVSRVAAAYCKQRQAEREPGHCLFHGAPPSMSKKITVTIDSDTSAFSVTWERRYCWVPKSCYSAGCLWPILKCCCREISPASRLSDPALRR